MFSEHFTLTKKHLGWLMVVGGVLVPLASLGKDLLTIANQSGFASLFSAELIAYFSSPLGVGPMQRLALMVCAGVLLLGLTLIPLGDKPL